MIILLKGLKIIIASAVGGKLIFIHQVFVKYNTIAEQAYESYYEVFSIAANGSFLHFL